MTKDNNHVHLDEHLGEILRHNLRVHTDRRGLTTAELARGAGIHPNVLYNFLNGHSKSLSLYSIRCVATFLAVTVDALLSDPGSANAHVDVPTPTPSDSGANSPLSDEVTIETTVVTHTVTYRKGGTQNT